MAEKIIYSFADLKSDIIKALQDPRKKIKLDESVTLVEGFVSQPLNMHATGDLVIGGPSIPLVVLVGKDTGRVYYFALKAILPNLGGDHE